MVSLAGSNSLLASLFTLGLTFVQIHFPVNGRNHKLGVSGLEIQFCLCAGIHELLNFPWRSKAWSWSLPGKTRDSVMSPSSQRWVLTNCRQKVVLCKTPHVSVCQNSKTMLNLKQNLETCSWPLFTVNQENKLLF